MLVCFSQDQNLEKKTSNCFNIGTRKVLAFGMMRILCLILPDIPSPSWLSGWLVVRLIRERNNEIPTVASRSLFLLILTNRRVSQLTENLWELINEVCSCLIRCNPVRILINAQNESPPFSSSLAYKCNVVGWDLTNVTLAEEDTGTGVLKYSWNIIFDKYLKNIFWQSGKMLATVFKRLVGKFLPSPCTGDCWGMDKGG